MGSARRKRLLRQPVARRPAFRRRNRQAARRFRRRVQISRSLRQSSSQLHQQALEQGVFPLRHQQRIPRQHSSRSASRPVVRQHDRPRRPRPPRNASQRPPQNLRLQRDEIRRRQHGRSKRHRPRRFPSENQRAGPGSLDRHHLRPRRPNAKRRNERRSLQNCPRHLSHNLRNQRLLVPHPRSLGHNRQLSRLHVHAPSSHLGHGNERASQRGRRRRALSISAQQNAKLIARSTEFC